jgi:hypothetical protein
VDTAEQAICPPDLIDYECGTANDCYAPSSAYRATCVNTPCGTRCGTALCTGTMRNCDYSSTPGTCETNTATNNNHCGACNNRCATGQTCVSGVCTGMLPACYPECVNPGPASSSLMQKTCTNGVSGEAACPTGRRNCNLVEGCETNITCDPSNCGGCGVACAAGQKCCAGKCATTC